LMLLLLLVVVWFGLAETKSLPEPTAVQRKALATLSTGTVRATGKHNGFRGLWLVAYNIPDADVYKVMNSDVAHYGLTAPRSFSGKQPSTAEGHYPRQDLAADAPGLCQSQEDDCLARTRTRLDAARKLVADHALLLDHMRELGDADHFHDLFRPGAGNVAESIPALTGLQLTDAALHFVDGGRDEALSRVCLVAATSRTAVTHGDSTRLDAAESIAYQRAAYLFAEMLAEMPAKAPLPDACTTAFAPVADADLDLCDAMKLESRDGDFTAEAMFRHANQNHSSFKGFLQEVFYNQWASEALHAVNLASYCYYADADIKQEWARMKSADFIALDGWEGALLNPAGEAIEVDSTVDYSGLASRVENLQRVNELVRTALDLRSKAAAAAGTSIDQLAAGALPKDMSWNANHRQLRMARSWKRDDQPADFSIPLPATRLQ